MNVSNANSLSTGRAVTGVWYRALHPRFISTRFATAHTTSHATRFNGGRLAVSPFRVFYLAETPQVALFEVQSLLGSTMVPGGVVAHPRGGTWVTFGVSVNLHNVADLTDVAEQGTIETTAQELTGDWRGYQYRSWATSVTAPTGLAPTQELGEVICRQVGFEGILTLSAKVPDQKVLIIFPANLGSRSWVEYFDPATGERERLDNDRWQSVDKSSEEESDFS